jgi:hypothetical protein
VAASDPSSPDQGPSTRTRGSSPADSCSAGPPHWGALVHARSFSDCGPIGLCVSLTMRAHRAWSTQGSGSGAQALPCLGLALPARTRPPTRALAHVPEAISFASYFEFDDDQLIQTPDCRGAPAVPFLSTRHFVAAASARRKTSIWRAISAGAVAPCPVLASTPRRGLARATSARWRRG